MKDSIVESVIEQFKQRSNVGINKYSTTLDRTDLSTLEWMIHFREELMDGLLYLERVIQDNQDMSMVIGIAGMPPNAVTTALISGGYIPLKPAGVRVNYWALAQEAGPIFALDVEGIGPALAGFDLGNWAAELPGA